MYDKELAHELICLLTDNIAIIEKRTAHIHSPVDFTPTESGMILPDSISMKRVPNRDKFHTIP